LAPLHTTLASYMELGLKFLVAYMSHEWALCKFQHTTVMVSIYLST
jgi:hypothetical protein